MSINQEKMFKSLYAFSLNNFGNNSRSYEDEEYSGAQVQRSVWQGEALKAESLLMFKP